LSDARNTVGNGNRGQVAATPERMTSDARNAIRRSITSNGRWDGDISRIYAVSTRHSRIAISNVVVDGNSVIVFGGEVVGRGLSYGGEEECRHQQ